MPSIQNGKNISIHFTEDEIVSTAHLSNIEILAACIIKAYAINGLAATNRQLNETALFS